MGKGTVYCSVCGDRIPSSDFDKGRAVTFLQKHFCRKCALTVVRESSEGSGHDASRTPPPLKIRTQRVPVADKPRGALANTVPFLIAAAVGLVAMILLLYVLLSKRTG